MRRLNQLPRRGWILLPIGRRNRRFQPPHFLTAHNVYPQQKHQDDRGRTENKSEGTRFGQSVLEGSTVALLSLLGLALGGYAYNQFYKRLVLQRIENSFTKGAFSSNELVALGRVAYGTDPAVIQEVLDREYWAPRTEQPFIDDIVNGKLRGRYYLIIGEHGTGKRSLLLEAMRKVGGEGVAMLEAHSDLEVFRLRLGKALDFEFHEDYVGGLFSIKGPRDSSALLDIERALNKMEKVALKLRKERGRPLLLIVNNIHLVNDDANGLSLLEILEQRAEIWSANDLVTTIFTSDENWTFERLTPHATNMQTISIRDLHKDAVIPALKQYRARFHDEELPTSILEEVYSKVGGRLIFLTQVAKSADMLATCKQINRKEKVWLLAQCWILGDSMEPDVEENQKFCTAAMILARELVHREKHVGQGELPEIPLHEARQIITRADYTQGLDHINVIHIDPYGMVRADSVAMQNAFREICTEDGFEEHLKATLNRLDELEGLSRMREVAFTKAPTFFGGEVPVQTYCAKV